MKNRNLFIFFLLLPFTYMNAQEAPTDYQARIDGFVWYEQSKAKSWWQDITFQNIGPRVCSGRVVDVAVDPNDPNHFIAAFASGGLWRTKNNGHSFEPIFDQAAAMTIGAIACDFKSGTIWVGTGEANSSRSSYAGMGMYVSRDAGNTWTWSGLPESHHIGKIILHPHDPNQIHVSVVGHLYSANEDRGLYRSMDGGVTWEQTLYLNDETGSIDIVRDPLNPDMLYCAMWSRSRTAWNFIESGEGSGIYQSNDNGVTWSLITTKENGFPSGEGCGRIGLACASRDGTSHLFALVDNYHRRPEEDKKKELTGLQKDALRTMDKATFIALEDELLEGYLRQYQFPKKYTAASVKKMVQSDKITPLALVIYLEDANAQLFDTPVIGAEVYRYDSTTKKWSRTHQDYIDDLYYSYGYYFGKIIAEPENPEVLYLLGVPILKSADGGKTFENINGENVHVDHHSLWVNPANAMHLLLGNDGGLNMSYDGGKNWNRLNRLPVGQFYAVNVDSEKPFNVYGGLQDNGVWKGSITYKMDNSWEMNGRYPYEFLLGGDGMQVEIDPRNQSEVIYTGYQFGHYFRINTTTQERKYITPKPELGQRPYRWNWQTPIHLSRHNPDILYMGSERLLRSLNRGDDFVAISPDLTKGGIPGDVPFGTITSVHESPLRFGLLYAGTDDGFVHVSRDGGFSWSNITSGLPEGMWISRVQASAHAEGRVYVSVNGYRNDHFAGYIFRSDDYGATWQRLGPDLPHQPVNVVREDPKNPNAIYVGTDLGVYASVDGGNRFMPFTKGLPNVPVHDVVIHPTESKIVIGTHGRSLFLGDILPLQELKPEIIDKAIHIFAIGDIFHNASWGTKRNVWRPANEPTTDFTVFSKMEQEISWSITQADLTTALATGTANLHEGINTIPYNLTIDKDAIQAMNKLKTKPAILAKLTKAENGQYYLPAGEYKLTIHQGKTTQVSQSFKIEQ